MTTLSELRAKIEIIGADRAKHSLVSVRDALKDTAKTAVDMGHHGKAVASALRTIGSSALDTAVNIGKANVVIAALAAFSGFGAAKNMDSLVRGMASVSRGAEDLRGQLGRLKEVAKLPGLGFEEAVQGSLALQSTGLSAQLAERSLKAFGNALASVGKGKDDLNGVTLALQQMASKGKISAEEINQVGERTPQVRAALNAAFGTSDSEELQKLGINTTQFIEGLVSELEKLPKVTGGVANTIENLSDRLQQALLPLGKGLVAMFEAAAPSLDKALGKVEDRLTGIGEVFAAIGKSGVLAETLEKVLGLTDAINGDFREGFARVAATVLTVIGNLPPAIDQTRAYLLDLFKVLGNNAEKVGIYIGGRFEDIFSRIASTIEITTGVVTDSIDRIVKVAGAALQVIAPVISGIAALFAPAVGAMFDSLKPAFGKLLEGVAMDAIPGGSGMKALKAVWEGGNVKFPNMDTLPIPPIDSLFSTLTQGKDENTRRILASLGPLSDIPDGLNYGGGQSGVPGQRSAVEASLQNIEWNTKATADALSLRRQVTGGGELGQIGVTPAELLGGNPNRRAAYGYGGSTGDLYAQAVELLRRAAEQTANSRLARASGSGMAFKPR